MQVPTIMYARNSVGSHTNVPWTRRIKVNSLPVSYWTFWAFKTYPKMLADPLTITWGWRILATLIAVTIVVRVRSWLRLRHIPGPPFAAFSKLWLLRKTSGGRFHLDTAEACEKYGIVLVLQSLRRSSLLILNSPGPIVRIGPNDLVTNDLEVWRKISAVRSPYIRSNWYNGIRFDPDYDSIISERDDKIHNALRAKMAAGVRWQSYC
jgi:hypothetical protein